MAESSIKNIEGSILIPINPNTSKKTIPISTLIFSPTIILNFYSPKTFFFKSSNVHNFFNQYSQIYINYQFDE